MSSTNHVSHSPDVPALPGAFEENEVRYVLVGSVAALAHGVDDFAPGDLDIVPGGDRGSPSRLAAVLDGVEASPEPVAGHWEARRDGEYAWVSDDMTPDSAANLERWEPNPDDVDSFDLLFGNRLARIIHEA